ncbi:LysR family transcriptional regulator [Gemmobacter lanyuensis]
MDSDLDLSALRAFRAVVREGSFSAAALLLRVPKSTLSKRVADLETRLGVRLIERSTRHLRITQEGEMLLPRAERLLSEADDIRRALGEAGGMPKGHLRIAVPPVMGHVMMGGIGARFRAAHPEVTLEAHFLDRTPDLLEEGFDGAICFGPLEDSSQIARLIVHGHAVLAAAPDLPGLADLHHPEDLPRLPQVGIAASWAGPWPLVRGNEEVRVPMRADLLLGSFLAVRDAAAAGAGLHFCLGCWRRRLSGPAHWCRCCRNGPARAGALLRLPSAHSMTARLRCFIDFLSTEVQAMEPPG